MRGKPLWRLVNRVLAQKARAVPRVVLSSHSVDVLATGVSKANLVRAVAAKAGVAPDAPLCIGDRGQWPGNDFELLALPYSLSVDEVSESLLSCWNVLPRGISCVPGTMSYLSRMEMKDGAVRMSI